MSQPLTPLASSSAGASSSSVAGLPCSAPTHMLKSIVTRSNVLDPCQKRFYLQMIDCVAQYGIENNQALFHAAGCCFDIKFGANHPKNIISIRNYLQEVMGEASVLSTVGENEYISADFFAHDRPGFFLLTPKGTIYFLKEGSEGTLVYYNAQEDRFDEASQFPVTGDEKLVILNKSVTPGLKTYVNTPTPDGPVEGKFYQEEQEGRKCGIHAAHAFLGFPVIHETELSLMRLEQLARMRAGDLASCLYHRRIYGEAFLFLPPGQQDVFLDKARFETAQNPSEHYQAELGNSSVDLEMILLHLASKGKIDAKYRDLKRYRISYEKREAEYARKYGLLQREHQVWDEALIQDVLGCMKRELEPRKVEIEAREQRLEELEKSGANNSSHPDHELYIQLSLEQQEEHLHHIRKNLEKTLEQMRLLSERLKVTDRLLVVSDSEDHSFAMRKLGDHAWVVIDSMNPEQVRIENPWKWLQARMHSFFEATESCSYQFIAL